MKILHVNYYAGIGGAGIAALNLHRALLKAGADSHFYAVEAVNRDLPGLHLASSSIQRRCRIIQKVESALLRLDRYNGIMPRALNLLSSGAKSEIEALRPDLIHIHWIHGGLLTIPELPRFSAPVVWTWHDAWAYCGAEHYHAINDNRYQTGYVSGSDFWNRHTWQIKHSHWDRWQPTCISPSSWLLSEAKQSMLFSKKHVQQIPNCVNTDIFTPKNRKQCRQKSGFLAQDRILMFGAMSLNDRNKGGQELWQALALLKQRNIPNLKLLLVGDHIPDNQIPLPALQTGRINTPEQMADLYRAADVFVLASKYDNLPNMLLEAIACGTPSVGFPIGGIPEILKVPGNGTIARAVTAEALADALQQALLHPSAPTPTGLQSYTPERVAQAHLSLYSQLA